LKKATSFSIHSQSNIPTDCIRTASIAIHTTASQKFVSKLLILVADMEPMKKEDPLYILVRSYRGKIGNLDLVEFKKLLSLLEERALEKSKS